MKKDKLFVPGPVNVSEGLEHITYFRDSDFTDMVLENERLLKEAVGCKEGRVVPLTCSGTGGMDSIVTNLISKEDKVLVIDGGSFGNRWYEICDFYGLDVEKYSVPFGKDIDFEKFVERVEEMDPTVVLTQHHETSSGQLHNVKKIGKITREKGILFVVDAISSFFTDPYLMDEYNVDITLVSTQKGLRLDAGMCFVILNETALDRLKEVEKTNYYNNFDTYLDDYNLGRGHVPFTPVVDMIYKVNSKLKGLNRDEEIEKINRNALAFRDGIKDLPVEQCAETPSNFLTSLKTKENYNAGKLYDFLKSERIFVTPTGKQFDDYLKNASNTFFRVAHIGCDISEHEDLVNKMRRFFK